MSVADLAQVDWAATPLGSPSGLAAEPADGGEHSAVVAVPDVDGVGAGADLLLQRRLSPRHPGPQISVGAGPAGQRGVGGDLGRHRSADRPGAVDRSRPPGTRRCCCSWSAPATRKRPTTRSPTARCATTTVRSSACCAWSARTRSRSSASGGWRRCGTWGRTPAWCAPRKRVLTFADRQLGHNLRDLPFTLTYLFDESGDARLAGTSGIAAGHPAAPALLAADDAAVWPVRRRPRVANRCWSNSTALRIRNCRPETGPNRRRRRWWSRCCEQGGASRGFLVAALNRYRPVNETNTRLRRRCRRRTSPRESAAPAATGPSSGGPRSWPNSTAPRPRSSPTSATSSAPR